MQAIGQPHARSFYPQERTSVRTEYEAGWASVPVWIFWKTEKSLAPTGFRTPDCLARSLAASPTVHLWLNVWYCNLQVIHK